MPDESITVWEATRPHTMVVACSDGRLQRATDAFLERSLGLSEFDRLYVPGGGGALAATDRDVFRAQQIRHECKYLVQLHQVREVILLFHGPAVGGPPESVCADYRRKLPWADPGVLRERQARDAVELLQLRAEWAADARVALYRCEVAADRTISFRELDPVRELEQTAWGQTITKPRPKPNDR